MSFQPRRLLNPLRSMNDGIFTVSLYPNVVVDFGDVDDWEFGPSDEFTIAVQFIPRQNRNSGIFGRCNYSDLVKNWTWAIYTYADRIGFGMGDGSNYFYVPTITYYYTFKRYFVVVSSEAYGGKVRIYVNGKLKAVRDRNIGQLRQTNNSFVMGLRASDMYFDGYIISAYIWRRTLTDYEVGQLYWYWDNPPRDGLIFFVFPNSIDRINKLWRNYVDMNQYGVIGGHILYVSFVNYPSKRNLVV